MANRLLILWMVFVGVLFTQDFSLKEVAAGAFLGSGGMEIIASADRITINHPASGKVTQEVKGVKKFISSPSGLYTVVLSFNFQPGKSDYPVYLYLVSHSSGLIYTKTITAPFDLPHPLFAVDDKGVIYSFEPLRMKLTTDLLGNNSEIMIVDNAEFQLERTFFLKADAGSVTGAVNILGRDDTGENIVLFFYSADEAKLQSVRLQGSTVSGLDRSGNQILLSVNHESEAGVFTRSRVLNSTFSEGTQLTEPAAFILSPDRFITRQGVITGQDGAVSSPSVLRAVKAITGVYTLSGEKKLLSAVTNGGNEFFIYHTASGELRKAEGLTAGKTSRMEFFVSGSILYAVEDYIKTTIYQIN